MFLTFLPPIVSALDADIATAIPTVTTQPASLTAYEYLTATFTVVATGGGLSYQWQKSDNAGADWSNVTGATSSTYNTSTLTRAADNSDQYRCVVTNILGTVNSNAATLTVWSPAALTGLQLWLDAADATTILEAAADPAEDGDTVSQWSDKSGNVRHATASTTAKPTYRATGQNGRGSIEFNGSSNYLSVGTTSTFNFLHNNTDSLVVFVFKAGTSSDPNTFYVLFDNCSLTANNAGYSLYYDDRASVPRNNAFSSQVGRSTPSQPASQNVGLDAIVPNQYHIYMERLRAGNATASSRSQSYVDGYNFPVAENAFTGAHVTSNHTSVSRIGAAVSGVGYLLGNIAEVIACNNPNTADWPNLQRYLSDKWGITIDDLTVSSLARISDAVSAYDAFGSIYKTGTDLVSLFRSADSHVGTKGVISRSVSSDSGSTWTAELGVFEDATYDLRDPNGIVLDNGDLLVASSRYNFGTSLHVGGIVYRSSDAGDTWSTVSTVPPRSGYNYWFPYGRWQTKGGVIYAPIYVTKTADSKEYSEVWKTEDEGETWTFVSQLGGYYNEMAIINTSGTNWLAVCRADNESVDKMAWFTSSDDMATWSSATLAEFGLSAVSPNLVSWDGEIWLFIGDRTGTPGIKWYKWTGSGFVGGGMVYIAGGTNCGYPSAVVNGNEMHLTFFQQYTDPGMQYVKITKN